MSHQPSTPVKVPNSTTNYTPATLDPDLRSQINTLLLREGHINKIQEHLLHSLDAHSSNWPSAIQSHALTLLRSGEVSTFPALIRRVLEDVRHDTNAAAADEEGSNNNNSSKNGGAGEKNGGGSDVNGAATTNGSNNGSSSGGSARGGVNGVAAGDANLAIPTPVVEAVLKVTRESLEAVCEIDDGATGG